MDKMDAVVLHRFSLREGLYLGFFATFIVIFRAVLRFHLNVPGHVMFFTMFFLLLGKGCVPRMWSATLIGLMAGVLSILLGMGKGGPLTVMKFVLPGLLADCGGLLYPGFATSVWGCVIIGGVASAIRAATFVGVDWLVGMEESLILGHFLLNSSTSMIFGSVGSLFVPYFIRRLRGSGLLA